MPKSKAIRLMGISECRSMLQKKFPTDELQALLAMTRHLLQSSGSERKIHTAIMWRRVAVRALQVSGRRQTYLRQTLSLFLRQMNLIPTALDWIILGGGR